MDRSAVPYSNGFSRTVERRFNPSTYHRALAEQLDISSTRWAAVDGYVHFPKLHLRKKAQNKRKVESLHHYQKRQLLIAEVRAFGVLTAGPKPA